MTAKTTYTIKVNGTEIDVQIDIRNGVSIHGRPGYEIDWVEIDVNRYSLLINGKSFSMTLERSANGAYIANFNGKEYHCTVEDERSKRLREFISDISAADGPVEITAPMPGMVIDIAVQKGDSVVEKQALVVLEAMKMENEIRSVAKGKIGKIYVQPGQAVEKGQSLMTIII